MNEKPTLEDALKSDDSTLTVNILRLWDAERVRRFALHLLGDDFQTLFAAAREWREAARACGDVDAPNFRRAELGKAFSDAQISLMAAVDRLIEQEK